MSLVILAAAYLITAIFLVMAIDRLVGVMYGVAPAHPRAGFRLVFSKFLRRPAGD